MKIGLLTELKKKNGMYTLDWSLLYSFAPAINYTYQVTENSNTVFVNELVHPRDFLNKSLLGFNIGVSKTMFMKILSKFDMTASYFGQFGVDPGYNEKYFNNVYFRAGIMIGIAKAK